MKLIEAKQAKEFASTFLADKILQAAVNSVVDNCPAVDAYTEEQVDSIIQKADLLEIENRNLEQEVDWLKNCLNCELRKECPRHCGKVVHGCDHWIYGDTYGERRTDAQTMGK